MRMGPMRAALWLMLAAVAGCTSRSGEGSPASPAEPSAETPPVVSSTEPVTAPAPTPPAPAPTPPAPAAPQPSPPPPSIAEPTVWPHDYKFTGAELVAEAKRDFGRYALQSAARATTPVEGVIKRRLYVATGTTDEISRNYEEFLREAGFNVLLASEDELQVSLACKQSPPICGMRNGQVILLNYGSSTEERYASYERQTPSGPEYAVVAVAAVDRDVVYVADDKKETRVARGKVAILVDSIAPKAVEKKMVKETSGFMADQLSRTGQVDLYGIYFDTNKADLKPESADTLSQIAKLMAEDPTLKLQVTGHTDNVGAPDYNDKLSLARAEAVVAALIGQYKVDASRLIAAGKGQSMPVADNTTEEGRAKNRRVTLSK